MPSSPPDQSPPSTVVEDKTSFLKTERRSEFDDVQLSQPRMETRVSMFDRLLNRIRGLHAGRTTNNAFDYHAAPTENVSEDLDENERTRRSPNSQSSKWLRWLRKAIWQLPLFILCVFGALHILLVLFGKKRLFWDVEEYQPYLPDWSKLEDVGKGPLSYPTDFTRNVLPIPCNSHNDYQRKRPLLDALRWGCTSVEADVWHFDGHDELSVGHNTASLIPDATFTSLYVDPLVEILDTMNPSSIVNDDRLHGVFDMDPEQALMLLVDFKTDGHTLFPHVLKQLDPLRQKNYLSYWNGGEFISRAVTVIGTGNTPFDLVVQNEDHREIFFDAPLDMLWESPRARISSSPDHVDYLPQTSESRPRADKRSQGNTGTDIVTGPDDFNSTNSYFASVPFSASIGYPWRGHLTEKQLDLIRGQIQGAKRRGLKARYWETPSWPTSLRNYIWQVLVNESADILNVDDLKSAAAIDWNAPVDHAWFDA